MITMRQRFDALQRWCAHSSDGWPPEIVPYAGGALVQREDALSFAEAEVTLALRAALAVAQGEAQRVVYVQAADVSEALDATLLGGLAVTTAEGATIPDCADERVYEIRLSARKEGK